jgi:hypothetical protein
LQKRKDSVNRSLDVLDITAKVYLQSTSQVTEVEHIIETSTQHGNLLQGTLTNDMREPTLVLRAIMRGIQVHVIALLAQNSTPPVNVLASLRDGTPPGLGKQTAVVNKFLLR